MSTLLCLCAPVGAYNYSDMQGDSPKSLERDKEKASKEKRQVGERFEEREYK